MLNEVWTLKQHRYGDIVIAGSFQLVRTLIEHDLVDELRLKIFPIALRVGERLFGETSDKKPGDAVGTRWWNGTPYDGVLCHMALMDIDYLDGERRDLSGSASWPPLVLRWSA